MSNFRPKPYSNNTSGYAGVSWHKRTKKWRAYIRVNRKQIHLGVFPSIKKAIRARRMAEWEFFAHHE